MARSGSAPPPLLLLLAGLALLDAARAEAGGDLSLHPPYFNLAEGARVAASATCGEEAPARGPPRPTEDLYCKLVGGPVAGGDPNQTIQVSAGWGQGRRGPAGWTGDPAPRTPAPQRIGLGLRNSCPSLLGAPRVGPKPRVPPRLPGSTFRGRERIPARQRTARPSGDAPQRPRAEGTLARGPWRPRVPGSR